MPFHKMETLLLHKNIGNSASHLTEEANVTDSCD